MAMRAIMKKFSSNIRLMERLSVPPRCFSSAVVIKDLNNKAVVCDDLEKLLKDHGGKVKQITYKEWCERKGVSEIDRRWDEWVESCHERWQKKNAEEQRAELNTRWAYLRDFLHREGVDTSNHRLLLSIRDEGSPSRFTVGSPDRGLVSINELDYSFRMPRQSVKGLLCLVAYRYEAFMIYNPMTGESSPSFEITERQRKHGSFAFGFDTLTGEHKVIWISSTSDPDPAVVIFTVGKNTWRRIDAVPPIATPTMFYNDPLYVDGCLYWRIREENGELEPIMRFDIATEKFRVIPVPDFVIDTEDQKQFQSIVLLEIDGSIAVVDWMNDLQFFLWIMHEDSDGNIKWTKEIVDLPSDMPYGWPGEDDLNIEALTGTNLIFIRLLYSDSVYYYNRTTKESIRFPVSQRMERIMQL